ncbi:hypothetical protein BLA15816_02299 [Burkholderia lata]|uniref:Transposase IS200-like domain-containing protein n=1 Tax=Burkholderia lata (strain ATCC 17760 / DSM 23089 / LMG 22485 / NCIMB 9086 / R18194 / 383) TaxID=482957 RepID=A0A6P2NVU6_BURL3|nr:hypothetical protein BLA15816_02299 [Burkholderia lata]VWB99047.1 hypothetical protein BLA15945_04801 [Burkholderia lata]
MHVHLVVVTEYRCDEFIMEILDDMRGIFSGVCRDFEAERAEFDDEDDHVYLLVDYQLKVASERIQGRLKSHDPTEVLLQHSQKSCGAVRCGLGLTLPEVLAEHLSKSFANTSNNRNRPP